MPEEMINYNPTAVADVAKKKNTRHAIDPNMIQSIINQNATQEYYDTLNGAQQPAANTEDENSIQSMFDKRKAAMEQRRALNTTTAKHAALGNVLRSLVQPLGWAVGGSVAPVIPYDSRQYIDAYNRALQYDNNIMNIGAQEDAYKVRSAEERARLAQREAELERQHNHRMAEIDARNKKGNASYDAAEGRAYFDYVRNYRIMELKGTKDLPPLMSEDEFYGRGGGSLPVVNGIGDAVPAGEEVKTPADKTKIPPKKLELTPDEKAVIAKWEKYDKNKDGILSPEEMKKNWIQFRKPKANSNTAEAYRKAIAKRNKIEGKKPAAKENKSTGEKKLTARDIMK